MTNKKDLTGKYIIVWDTLVDGWESVVDENGQPALYDRREVAISEIFDDALSMLSNRTPKELEEYNEGITLETIKEMEKIQQSGDVAAMEKFLNDNPDANDNNEFVVKAEDYIKNRKAIFGADGLKITGE